MRLSRRDYLTSGAIAFSGLGGYAANHQSEDRSGGARSKITACQAPADRPGITTLRLEGTELVIAANTLLDGYDEGEAGQNTGDTDAEAEPFFEIFAVGEFNERTDGVRVAEDVIYGLDLADVGIDGGYYDVRVILWEGDGGVDDDRVDEMSVEVDFRP